MDRVIAMAWRALYVTVGACAVLVAQSFVEPAASPAPPADVAAPAAPSAPALRVSGLRPVAPPTGASIGDGTACPAGRSPRSC